MFSKLIMSLLEIISITSLNGSLLIMLIVSSFTVYGLVSVSLTGMIIRLLTDLIDVQVGDEFRIDVLNQRYKYIVDQILVVEPNETENLEIVEGKQYATIITCTPYGVNTHRLLVRGVLQNDKLPVNISEDAVVLHWHKIFNII